jgi:hypothetical protein
MKTWTEAWKMTVTPSKSLSEMSKDWYEDSMVLYFGGIPSNESAMKAIKGEIETMISPPRPMEEVDPVENTKRDFYEACLSMVREVRIPENPDGLSYELSVSARQGFLKLELIRVHPA